LADCVVIGICCC